MSQGHTITNKFRVNSSSVFITYSQCPSTMEAVRDHLLLISHEHQWDVIQWVVAQEAHEDGNSHLHAFLKFSSKVNIKDSRIWDIKGDAQVWHPNWQGCRNDAQVLKYCCKEGSYIASYIPGSNAFKRALESGSSAAAMKIMRTDEPRVFVLYAHSLRKNFDLAFASVKPPAPPFPLESFGPIPPKLQFWMDTQLHKEPKQRPLALFLIGPSRTCKTEFAKAVSVGPYIHWKDNINLNTWNDDATTIIFDDIKWKNLTRFNDGCKGLFNCTGDTVTLTQKSMGNMTFVHDKKVIVCLNQDDYCEYSSHMDQQYWDYSEDKPNGNALYVFLTRTLRKEEDAPSHPVEVLP